MAEEQRQVELGLLGWSSYCVLVVMRSPRAVPSCDAFRMAKRIPAVNQRGLAAAPEWCRARSRTGEPVSESETHFTQHNQDLQ
jgi:hypothetical protein